MLKKIVAKFRKKPTEVAQPQQYTQEGVSKLVKDAYKIGYNDGKRDGIAVARQLAIKSLKEIIWQQNQRKNS